MSRHPLQNGRTEDLSGLRRIAVFRALQLGDLMLVVPALRALRAAAPHANITLIGLPWTSGFVQRFSQYVDDFMPFPGYPGLPESSPDRSLIPEFIRAVQQRNFDLAIQLHGNGKITNPLIDLFNSERVAGFYQHGEYCPDPDRFLPWSDSDHEVGRAVKLMEFLGAPSKGLRLEFPLLKSDYQALTHTHQNLPERGSYACIHAGARLPSRRWPAGRFAEVADQLAHRGFHIVLTGTAPERSIADAISAEMRAPVFNLVGKTGLGSLAALINNAGIVIGNDTSVSHVAAAVNTPNIVICSGSDSARWAGMAQGRYRVVSSGVACRPCSYSICPIGHPCALDVSVDMVMSAALDLLDAAASMAGTKLGIGVSQYQVDA